MEVPMFMKWRGYEIHYVDEGHGAPLVFLHGLGGNCDNWLYQRRFFSKTHRVISIDLPGHGRSAGRDVKFRDYWEVIDEVVSALSIGPVTICGLSKGARVGLMFAARRPDLVRSLIVINAFVHLEDMGRQERLALYDLLIEPDGPQLWASKLLGKMGIADGTTIANGFRRAARTIDAVYIHTIFHELIDYDQRPELSSVKCPVLLIRGDKDEFVPEYCLHELEALLPDSRSETLHDSGHLPYLEQPERFNTIVFDFIEEQSGNLSP